MSAAAARVTRALSLGLGLEAMALDERVLGTTPHWQAKLASYPPNVGPGVGAHSDSGWLTLLWADEPGLEAQLRTGEWVAVPPRDGAVAVNLGEMLQLASGGYYRATPHRVGASSRRRVSLPFFWNPSLSAVVDVVCDPSLLPWTRDRPPAETRHSLLRAYGANAFKSLARSHPLVFERHHPDLMCSRGRDGRGPRRRAQRPISSVVLASRATLLRRRPDRHSLRATTTRTSARPSPAARRSAPGPAAPRSGTCRSCSPGP